MTFPTFFPGSRRPQQPVDLTVVREILEEQRDFRVEQLSELRRSLATGGSVAALTASGTSGSPVSMSVADSADVDPHGQVAAMLAQAADAALAEIEAALTRLDSGSYGRCESCASPIANERLEILPYARHCVSCQRQSQLGAGHPAGRISV